jgi:hypothetical protein
MNGMWLIFSNSVGELDRRFVPITDGVEPDVTGALVKFIKDIGIWADGDSIKLEEGWSEGPS